MKADEFLKISEQFRLGNLVTESSHPVTANLSDIAAKSTELGLSTLFDVDKDVVEEQRKMTERIMQLVNEHGHIPKTFALEADIEVSLFLNNRPLRLTLKMNMNFLKHCFH